MQFFFQKRKRNDFFSSIIKRIIDNNIIIKTSFCFTCGVVTKKISHDKKKFRKKILRVNDGREDKKNKHNSAFFKEGKENNNKLFRKKICS